METASKSNEADEPDETFLARCGGVCALKQLVNGPEIVQYTTADGTVYNRGDCVYLESRANDTPFNICNILNFKLDKKDNVLVNVKWYYRVTELPDQLYTLLLQDRDSEWLDYRSKVRNSQRGDSTSSALSSLCGGFTTHSNSTPDLEHSSELNSASLDQLSASSSPVELWLNDEFNFSEQEFKERELFSSKQFGHVAAKNLRGHCSVTHFRDITEALEFDPLPDHFFFVLQYNPQNRRLANFKGEIKVGAAYQAVLPELRSESLAEQDELKEVSAFKPNRIFDEDLHVFLNAARSLAATFANMRYGGVEHARKALSKDVVVMKAIDALHQADYDRDKAIHLLLSDPAPRAPMDYWSSEDKKLFVKGLRQMGKNFNSIRTDYLPHRTTAELVEFYYVWKKTPGAQNSSSFGAATRVQNSKPNSKGAKPFSGKKKNGGGGNSGVARISKILSSQVGNSGTDVESDDSIMDPQDSAFSCKHCGTTASKNFVHWGAEKLLLCFECRLDYQKYGRLPKTAEAPSPYLFKPVSEQHMAQGKGQVQRASSTCSLPVSEAQSENVAAESPVQSPSVQKKKRKSRNSFDGQAESYKRAKQREPVSRSDTPSSESTESNETTSSGRQTTETTSTTPELFEAESSTNSFANPLAASSESVSSDSRLNTKAAETANEVSRSVSCEGKLETFAEQFPPEYERSASASTVETSMSKSTPKEATVSAQETTTVEPDNVSKDSSTVASVSIKIEPMDSGHPMASAVAQGAVCVFKKEDVKVEVIEGVVNVVGRSGHTPPPSPSPLSCSDEVQLAQTRHVTEQCPNKRIFKLVRSWRRKPRSQELSSNSCARTDLRCVPLFAASFQSSKSAHIKKEKASTVAESNRVPPSPRDVPTSLNSSSDRMTTPLQAGTFPQTPVTPISSSVSPAAAVNVSSNVSMGHPSMMNPGRTPLGPRGQGGLHLQMSSPLSAFHQRTHPSMHTPSSSASGWTPEEIAERQMRNSDFRLNAELIARLKETANLHPGASGSLGANSIPTSSAAAFQHLQQNEQAALTAALLQHNLNPGALTPGALNSIFGGGNSQHHQGSMPNLDSALMLRHLQEEQRIQDHLAAQARLAQQLNYAAAGGHQQPQQQHHQHSHLHLHMHQQLAVAQAAAAQAALGLPPFPGFSPSALQGSSGLNSPGSSVNSNASASAAQAFNGADPAQLAAILGLPPFSNAATGTNQSNALLSSVGHSSSNNPFSVGISQAMASRERELHAQAAAFAGLMPGGAGASGNFLSNHQLMAAAAAANNQNSRHSLPEDYLSALTNNHSQFNAQMAQEHELRRLMVLEQERRAAFAMNATSNANSNPSIGHMSTAGVNSPASGSHHAPAISPASASAHHNL